MPSSRTGTARGQGPMAGNSGLSPQLSEQCEVRWIRWYWSRAEWCGFLDGDMAIGEWRTTCYHRRTGAGATQTEALTKDTRYVTARGKLTMPGVWRWRVGGYLEMLLVSVAAVADAIKEPSCEEQVFFALAREPTLVIARRVFFICCLRMLRYVVPFLSQSRHCLSPRGEISLTETTMQNLVALARAQLRFCEVKQRWNQECSRRPRRFEV